ncbi:hypothetical protein DPMN_058779 [Dreissena polymorpha]|uniref:Uncharacterized protein n=1 Tax=Dreissena polymorpha TaxID=45954 RepID=A0A9D4C2D3_DREPO|nr:hypothetical protein DPMN_058779 [Dreissena polymorpha]
MSTSIIPPSHRTGVLTAFLRRPRSQLGRHRRRMNAVRTQEDAVKTPKIAQDASPRRSGRRSPAFLRCSIKDATVVVGTL